MGPWIGACVCALLLVQMFTSVDNCRFHLLAFASECPVWIRPQICSLHHCQQLAFSSATCSICACVAGHDAAICALEAKDDVMVSSDDLGNIIVWQAADRFRQKLLIKGNGSVTQTT